MEISRSLVRGEFPCHETLDYDGNEEGEGRETSKTGHCAGALIMLEKMGQPSQMMRICERINLYDASKLDMAAPVFESTDDFIQAQPRRKSCARSRTR
jgi:hypothetical protein